MTSPTLKPYIEAVERSAATVEYEGKQAAAVGYYPNPGRQLLADAARLRALAEALKKAEYAWEYSTASHKAWLIPAPKEEA